MLAAPLESQWALRSQMELDLAKRGLIVVSLPGSEAPSRPAWMHVGGFCLQRLDDFAWSTRGWRKRFHVSRRAMSAPRRFRVNNLQRNLWPPAARTWMGCLSDSDLPQSILDFHVQPNASWHRFGSHTGHMKEHSVWANRPSPGAPRKTKSDVPGWRALAMN